MNTPSICVGCKWADWSRQMSLGRGICQFPKPPVSAVMRVIYEGLIYRTLPLGILSCPVREPEDSGNPQNPV